MFSKKPKNKVMQILLLAILASVVAVNFLPVFGADTTTDTLNKTFDLLGGMLDGFATLVPHFINLIVAFIPLMLLGAILGSVMLLIYALPKFVKFDNIKKD